MKYIFKKLMLVLLLISLIFLTFPVETGAVEIEFWTINLQPEFNDYFAEMFSIYENDNPGVKIIWQDMPFSAVKQKLIYQSSGDQVPDLVNLNTEMALDLQSKNLLSAVDQLSINIADEYFAGIWEATTVGEHAYAYPWYLSTKVLLYNKEIFRLAGLDPALPPENMDDIEKYSRQIRHETGLYGYMPQVNILQEFIKEGIDLFANQAKTEVGFYSKEAVELVNSYANLRKYDLIPASSLSGGFNEALQMFQEGRLAMLVSGPQFLKNIQEKSPMIYENIGVAALPTGRARKVHAAAMNLVIPVQSEVPVEAAKFAEFMSGAFAQLEFSKRADIFPSARKAVQDEYFLQKSDQPDVMARHVVAGQLEYVEDMSLTVEKAGQLVNVLNEEFSRALHGKIDAHQAVENMAEKWSLILGSEFNPNPVLVEEIDLFLEEIRLKAEVEATDANLTVSNTQSPVILKINAAERKIGQVKVKLNQIQSQYQDLPEQEISTLLTEAGKFLGLARQSYQKKNINEQQIEDYATKALSLAESAYLLTIQVNKVQARGLWLDHGSIARTKGEAGLRQMIRQIAQSNFNVIYPEVFYKGLTIIPDNELFRQDTIFQNWDVDPLKVIIDEAAKYELEVHGWVWVFNDNTSGKPGPILQEHPTWADQNKEGELVSYHGSTWLSHSCPEVQNYLLARYEYLVKNYQLAGINLDYIRFPEEYHNSFGYDDYTVRLFKDKYGYDPHQIKSGSKETREWMQFREDLVTKMVILVSKKLLAIQPDLILSADVLPGVEEARFRTLQNWGLWLEEGYLDYVLPMTYTENLFSELKDWLSGSEINREQLLYPGLSVFKLTPEQLLEQIELVNQLNPLGVNLFASAHLKDEHYQLLVNGPFREKAINPHAEPTKAIKLLTVDLINKINFLHEKNIINDQQFKILELATEGISSKKSPAEYEKYSKKINESDIDLTVNMAILRYLNSLKILAEQL